MTQNRARKFTPRNRNTFGGKITLVVRGGRAGGADGDRRGRRHPRVRRRRRYRRRRQQVGGTDPAAEDVEKAAVTAPPALPTLSLAHRGQGGPRPRGPHAPYRRGHGLAAFRRVERNGLHAEVEARTPASLGTVWSCWSEEH